MSLLTSLIAHWKLEETSGTRNDSHGTNHLTDNNTVLSGTGKIGTAADFEDTNSEFLSVADNSALSMGDIDFALACWCQLESKSSNPQNLIAKRAGNGALEYFLRYIGTGFGDVFDFEVSPDGSTPVTGVSATSFGSPSLATWYFVVAQHDSVNNLLKICVNDGTVDSTAYSGGVFDGTIDFRLGATSSGSGTEFWDGLIDSVSIWKRVLTAAEITQLYNGGAGLDYGSFGGAAAASIPIFTNPFAHLLVR